MSQEMARQDLQNVMQEYGSYIKEAVGEKYLALTAKWQVEDLVPGLSDIDFRVVLADSAGVEDWIVVDKACGQIHSRLARKYKRWWRILEHTPGCGLTCRQMRHPYWYCSEYHTWQVCHGEPGPIQALQREYATKDWQIRDELYHLGKFLYYYSPYQQGIDPPINLGDYVDKYDMHSRCWHYFTPAMLSAAALLRKKPFPGKRTALGWLIKQFPQKDVFKKILHMVDRLYDVPENDERTLRDEFDVEMFAAFKEMRELVRRNLKFISWPENLDEKAMKQRLADDFSREKSILSLTDSVRFARIRLGRYLFFLDAPDGFEVEQLLKFEGNWLRLLGKVPAETGAGILKLDAGNSAPTRVFSQALGRDLGNGERQCLENISCLAQRKPAGYQQLREVFSEAIKFWIDYYRLLEEYFQALEPRLAEGE